MPPCSTAAASLGPGERRSCSLSRGKWSVPSPQAVLTVDVVAMIPDTRFGGSPRTRGGSYGRTQRGLRKLLGGANSLAVVGPAVALLGACGGATAPKHELSLEPPRLPVVVATGRSTCALRTSGEIDCWAAGFKDPLPVINGVEIRYPIPDGPHLQIRGSGGAACSFGPALDVHCWGSGTMGSQIPLEGRYIDVDVSLAESGAICGVTTRGRLRCIPWSDYGDPHRAEPFLQGFPDGTGFRRVALGTFHACALRANGTIACWGEDDLGGTAVPAGSFIDVGVGYGFTCAVQGDGKVSCWGKLWDGTRVVAPELHDAIAVDAEDSSVCALRATGEVICWGSEDVWAGPQGAPPQARFRQLSVGLDHACGVTEDDRIACWGQNHNQALDVPEDLR